MDLIPYGVFTIPFYTLEARIFFCVFRREIILSARFWSRLCMYQPETQHANRYLIDLHRCRAVFWISIAFFSRVKKVFGTPWIAFFNLFFTLSVSLSITWSKFKILAMQGWRSIKYLLPCWVSGWYMQRRLQNRVSRIISRWKTRKKIRGFEI